MKLLNQQIIKNNNLKQLYNLIYQEPGISRAKLAKTSGLSKPTVSALIDELVKKRFVQDTGAMTHITTVGRKPNGLHLLENEHYVVAVCLSRNMVAAKLMDVCGCAVKEIDYLLAGDDTYVSASRQVFEKLREEAKAEKILGVCMIVPAMIDLERREIFSTTLEPGRYGKNGLLKELQDAFSDVATAIFNDTACAAYAEKTYAKVLQSDFAYINFQHGIGAALFVNNHLIGNATASYTQFGHYSVDPEGVQCFCGNRGCLELVISEESLKQRLTGGQEYSALSEKESITYGELSYAALHGDLGAQNVIRDMALDFSRALCNLTCIVRPKLIVIGGRGKELGPLFLEEVKQNMKTTGFRYMLDSLKLRYSFLDMTAYFAGGMKLYFDTYYDFTQNAEGAFFVG